jgi:alkanesulfonate monooxygenase SsuD/methylene tetrahydromethanopterin reductase-like flavin-dependent oxidoreductase (luciferase family)
LFVGSPDTVAKKIVRMVEALRISRFDLKYDVIGLPVGARSQTITLLGTEVAPRVRAMIAKESIDV